MADISPFTVDYYPVARRVVRENPLPERAVTQRAVSPRTAIDHAGVGRIYWDDVDAWSPQDVIDFAREMEIGNLLATNAKTKKPRPTGRLGKIVGLTLAPHFYANIINLTEEKESGALAYVPRHVFNSFDGTNLKTAAQDAGMEEGELINFCTGSSKYCRQTCLVITGQNPATKEAAHSKMKFSNALLHNPSLFVALLYKQLLSRAHAERKKGYDLICRLNMLSDLPWYAMCPELLEALEDEVTFYDYTKVPYWNRSDYRRVSHLLDLTFSYSGSNEQRCKEALAAGERIAVCFAPADPHRPATIGQRTTWEELNASTLVEDGEIELFGGWWPLVDGDESDFRIDDPPASIVSLNFKRPTISRKVATEEAMQRMERDIPESRRHFAKPVPDPDGKGARYSAARRRKEFWKKLGIDPRTLPIDEVIRISEDSRGRRRNPLEQLEPPAPNHDPSEPMTGETRIPMALIEGSNFLIGPHVPTVLED